LYKTYTLENGLRVLTHKISNIKSCSISLFIRSGTIFENNENFGISHLIEHLLFKGTKNNSSLEIAKRIDQVGGELNAFTTKEFTAIYSKVIDENIEISLELISDMILNPKFDYEDINKEKMVINEEINMYEDNPDELSYDLSSMIMFKNTMMEKPILGTKESLEKINRNMIVEYYNNHYTGENMVIIVAGNFDNVILLDLITNYFKTIPARKINEIEKNNVFEQGHIGKNKDLEQTYINVSFKGPTNISKDIYSYYILGNIIASTMSSRLFQKIREELGLVYSIHSEVSSYEICGDFSISYTLINSNVKLASMKIANELKKLYIDGITDDEFERAKSQLKGNFILDLETPGSIVELVGADFLFGRKPLNPNIVLKKINKVQKNDVQMVLSKLFKSGIVVSLVGRNCEKKSIQIYKIFRKELDHEHN
jgi:predicted Zn-dependent peptidase